jgi:hypothetical protein
MQFKIFCQSQKKEFWEFFWFLASMMLMSPKF